MRAHVPFVLPLALLLLAGCGGDPNKATGLAGKVTYNDNPVTGGTITFAPKEGGAFTRPIGADGTYTSPDMPPGTYTVTVETESLNPDKPKPPAYGPPGGAPQAPTAGGTMPTAAAGASAGKYMKIDPKYADPKTSGLSVTVKGGGGAQTQDFPLKGT